jgi:hypothetical protein
VQGLPFEFKLVSTVLTPTQMQLLHSAPQLDQSGRLEAERSQSASHRLRAGFDVQWFVRAPACFHAAFALMCRVFALR